MTEYVQMSFDDYLSSDEYIVRQISYHDALPFLLNVHYARRIPNIKFAYGLFHNHDLIGVVTYGIPASHSLCVGIAGEKYYKQVLELNRLVILPGYGGGDNASRLVGKSLRLLPGNWFVVSYADYGGWGHVGYVYQATNWLYTGMTKRRLDIAGGGANSHSRHYVKGSKDRVVRTEKHRYICVVANSKREKKQMLSCLRYPVLPDYPKGNSRHYDTTNPIGLLK